MRIDLPQCNLKTCRYSFDGNCTERELYERCDYASLKDSKWDEEVASEKLAQISDIVEGTIDHCDLEDALDLLYEIKRVVRR